VFLASDQDQQRSSSSPAAVGTQVHTVIAAYAKDMEVAVFNGHVHTTEIFNVDGVKYLMLGRRRRVASPVAELFARHPALRAIAVAISSVGTERASVAAAGAGPQAEEAFEDTEDPWSCRNRRFVCELGGFRPTISY